ncbi:MAG: nitroreductase family protein [Phycisphaerales bacterium]|nr:MAG: nitroreductase family protein [Phycisphaerales bacterium]
MNTFDAIYQRRAVKHYDPDHRFTKDEVTRLMEAAIQSPTSFNMQNWRFVLVTDPDLRQRIRGVAYDQAQVTDASLLVVMTADLKAWKKNPERYWRNAPKDAAEMLVGWMGPFHEGNEQLQRDEAVRSMGIAAQTIMLAAKALGYDSCPMIGFEADKVAELINLPEDHVIGMLIAVGKATKPAWPKPGQLPLEEVIVRDRFPSAG